MNTKQKLTIMGTTLIILLIVTTSTAMGQGIPTSIIDLEAQFAGFDDFLTNLNDVANNNTVSIASLETRVAGLETQNYVNQMNLVAMPTLDGAINPQSIEVLFYGDTLCKIEATGFLYIHFGGNTTVKHLNDCSTRNGNLIDLKSNADESFQEGSILVLERLTTNWEEVFQGQLP